ncbi:hypothetical protein B0H17DRAFT_455554 [Mycena rosella]|uniref:Uncharacterized protein n=1 Tax=Mycena rosella TaxID=1033263 RepID=A0AAD7DMB0_MYCRO|nr:hypothetical protein B0H17DRAFT_455554 [Mycena rosella]
MMRGRNHGWEARRPTTALGGLGSSFIYLLHGMARAWRVGALMADNTSSFDAMILPFSLFFRILVLTSFRFNCDFHLDPRPPRRV